MEKEMANVRQEDKSIHNTEGMVQRNAEKSAEQLHRIGVVTGQVGEEAARASANLLQEQAEMMQNAWRFGADMTSTIMGRSTEQLGRTLGVSGNEAHEAVERSAKNAGAILQSASVVTKGMNGISREYFELARNQFQSQLERMNQLWACRSPQEFAAVQTEIMLDAVKGMLERNRRMADMSVKLADDAGKRISESMQRAA